MDMIRAQGTHMSAQWLSTKVVEEPQLLEALPFECLCEMLLHSSSNVSALTAQLPILLSVINGRYLGSEDWTPTAYLLNFLLTKRSTKR